MPKRMHLMNTAQPRLVALIYGYMAQTIEGADGLGAAMGRTRQYVYKRLHDPNNLRLSELKAIRSIYGIDRDEFLASLDV